MYVPVLVLPHQIRFLFLPHPVRFQMFHCCLYVHLLLHQDRLLACAMVRLEYPHLLLAGVYGFFRMLILGLSALFRILPILVKPFSVSILTVSFGFKLVSGFAVLS